MHNRKAGHTLPEQSKKQHLTARSGLLQSNLSNMNSYNLLQMGSKNKGKNAIKPRIVVFLDLSKIDFFLILKGL